MKVRILQQVAGAQKASGLTVIIDVFRAFTVEAWLSERGAERILPVSGIQTAFDYRDQHPGAILCGERGGRMVDGFDLGNSPAQASRLDLTGKTVVHTTSAGTQGIANAKGADEIVGGALVNAKAIARYIRRKNPAEVSLVCMGLNGTEPTDEDTLCAQYIMSLLENRPIRDMEQRMQKLKETSGAKFFDPAQQDVFPEPDFHRCVELDRFDFVLRFDPETGCMQRVDVNA